MILKTDRDDLKMAGSLSHSSSSSSLHKVTQLKTALGVALLGVVLYHVLLMGYVFHAFAQAAAGPFGTTLAVTDEISVKYPLQFEILQKMVVLPIPNYAAQRYYESQREFFLDAARHFELHPYWSTYNEATPDMIFREVVTERMRSMHRQYAESGRMDYRIEKDRCAQFHFFRRNAIKHPEIKKTWYNREQLVADIESGAAVETMDHWPIFFKACHLTQRSSLGTFPISSMEAYQKQKPELLQWVNDKWVYRSRDVDRPWQKEGDALTDELTPAFLVQEPMTEPGILDRRHANFAMDGRVSAGLVELKVEVIWGKVYIMQMDASTIFLRDGTIEDYSSFMGAVMHRPGKGNERVAWISNEGYLDCVIEVAERAAQAAHIDYVRVDVFLDRSDPQGCAVNEISLSSGYAYYGHEGYMAKLWAGPLQRQMYRPFNSTAPVYELSTMDDMDEESAEE